MTTRTNVFCTLFVCMNLFLTSCAIDGNDPVEPNTRTDNPSTIIPNSEVLKSFDIKFPNAENVVWSTDDSYYVADFTEFSSVINAWFGQGGEWLLSKSSLTPSELNKEIHEAFLNSTYSSNQVISRSKLERKELGNIYVIETNNSSQNVTIYYTKDGDFIKTVKSYSDYIDRPLEVSEKVKNVVTSRFASAEILDIWDDSLGPKVGLMENNTYKIAALDSGYNWISTIWAVDEEVVPNVVMDSFKSSDYGSNELESVRIMENSDDLSYLFYFYAEGKNKIATIKGTGRLTSVLSY